MKRFDRPCPCMSGKKAFDCCFAKNKVTKENHWASIKARLVQNFIAEHPTDEEVVSLQQWVGTSRLAEFEEGMDAITVQHLLTDAYFFTNHTKEWGYFLIQNMKEIIQPKTHQILSSWQQPLFFVGKVLEIIDGFVIAEHYYTKEVIIIVDVEIEDDIIEDFIICHIVPGIHQRYYYLLSSAIILEKNHGQVIAKWRQRFEEANFEQHSLFFKEHILDCFSDLVGLKTISNSEVRDLDLGALYLIVSLDELLIDLDVKNDRLAFVFFNYLMDNGLSQRLRKKEGLLAAIIDFGIRYDFLPRIITQRKLAEMMNVSTSSVRRYSNKIAYYFEQDFDDNVFEKLRQPSYQIGTDANMDDYKEWQLQKHFEKMIFTNDVDRKRMEKKLEGIPFKPITNKDNAQKYAFEAYIADADDDRQRLAQLAINFDSLNKDACIIQSEVLPKNQRLDVLLEMLVRNQSVSHLENRKIVLLLQLFFTQQKYDSAWQLLQEIPVTKRQQSKELHYFYMTLCIYFEKIDDELLSIIDNKYVEDGMMAWLKWIMAKMKKHINEEQLHSDAVNCNPFVQKYMELDIAPYDYPTHKTCVKGDPGEAKFVHFVLFPLLKDKK